VVREALGALARERGSGVALAADCFAARSPGAAVVVVSVGRLGRRG
jgi:hypothetical protein